MTLYHVLYYRAGHSIPDELHTTDDRDYALEIADDNRTIWERDQQKVHDLLLESKSIRLEVREDNNDGEETALENDRKIRGKTIWQWPEANPSRQRYTVAIATNPFRQLLTVHKTRGPASVRGRLNGPGGKVEDGEQPLRGMIREFEEEVGLKTESADWKETVILTGKGWDVHFFRIRLTDEQAAAAAQRKVNDVGEPLEIIPLSCLNECQVTDNLRWIVPLSLDDSVRHPVRITDRS